MFKKIKRLFLPAACQLRNFLMQDMGVLISRVEEIEKVIYSNQEQLLSLYHKPSQLIDDARFLELNSKKYTGITFQDKIDYITYQFYKATGYMPTLLNPASFNEKMQWIKLFYRDDLMNICTDKFKVRKYVSEKIGDSYLVPLVDCFDSFDEIVFDKLPEQFVLKTNWGCGQNVICKDKQMFDIHDARNKFNMWMQPSGNHYFHSFEWSYKNIIPKILCEKYVEQSDGKLIDYKFLCYNGTVKNMFCVFDRFSGMRINFYDRKFNLLPFERCYKNSESQYERPDKFDEMVELAERLAAPFPFVRVDFYEVEKQIYFGELTFYPGNGMEKFTPIEWDYKLGGMLELPYMR